MQCFRLVSPLPIIRCPCDARLFGEDDPQSFSARHPPHGITNSPNLKTVRHWIDHVSLVGRIDPIEANAIMPAPNQRNVLGVRPAKRHRRTCRTTACHFCVRQVGSIPNLFGEHAALVHVRKASDGRDERFWITTGSEFVMTAFSRQNRPAPAYPGSVVSAAVIFLTVTVVIVTTPTRALRQIVLEDAIDYFDRIKHERIIWPSNAVPHQMKEIAAHNIPCCMQSSAIGDLYHLCVGIGMRIRFIWIGGINGDVVTRNSWSQFTRRLEC